MQWESEKDILEIMKIEKKRSYDGLEGVKSRYQGRY